MNFEFKFLILIFLFVSPLDSQCFLNYLAIIVINVYVNVWLLIPAGIMTVLFYLMRVVYVNTGRSFKRIEALSEFTNML